MGRGLYWEPVQFYYDVTAIVLSQPFLGHNLITPRGRLLRTAPKDHITAPARVTLHFGKCWEVVGPR
jgi:hypothetical protein